MRTLVNSLLVKQMIKKLGYLSINDQSISMLAEFNFYAGLAQFRLKCNNINKNYWVITFSSTLVYGLKQQNIK